MAILQTSAGDIDTGRFNPTYDQLDELSLDELQEIRNTLEAEAINIEYQLEISEGRTARWRATARYAARMRRHNVQVLDRYSALRKQEMAV